MLKQQQNVSGADKAASQGFTRVNQESLTAFDPITGVEPANSFFTTNGCVVLGNCLDQREIDHLNEFDDRTQNERPPTPVLTNWILFPERLTLHPVPKTKLFFSHWNTAQCEWVATGFADHVRESMPRVNK